MPLKMLISYSNNISNLSRHHWAMMKQPKQWKTQRLV